MATTEKLNIYQKLLKIQQSVMGLGKDKKSFGYDYVTGTKVLEHIKPLMNELGLILKQEVLSTHNTRMDYTTKNGAKTEILTQLDLRFTWIDCETGEMDVNLFGANGQNDFEKGFGSACTYSERYFLLKYFHIATDEDDIDNPDRKVEDTKPNITTPPKASTPTANTSVELSKELEEIGTAIGNIKTLVALEAYWKGLTAEQQANGIIKSAVNKRKTFLTPKTT